ncbi:hypothetical protein BTHI11S_05175 [Bosea thiooxidans]
MARHKAAIQEMVWPGVAWSACAAWRMTATEAAKPTKTATSAEKTIDMTLQGTGRTEGLPLNQKSRDAERVAGAGPGPAGGAGPAGGQTAGGARCHLAVNGRA